VSLKKADHDNIPFGFTMLYSLLLWRMEGGGLTTLCFNNDKAKDIYSINYKIGQGRNSVIFSAKDNTGKSCCIKIEPEDACHQVQNEIKVLPQLCGCNGVPQILLYGITYYNGRKWLGIVSNIVGKYSLKDLVKKHGFLSQQKVYQIANEAIDIIQSIHSRGFVYGDFKPEHFVFYDKKMYLVDYGTAALSGQKSLYWTPTYSSTNVDAGLCVGFNSDFESLWFVLLSLCQPLEWNYTNSALELLSFKLKSLPECKKNDYPLLAALFSPLIN